MESGITEFKPTAKDLLVYEKRGCFIVYDHSTQKAHDLNPLAAAVWRRCDGTKSVEEIVRLLNRELSQPVDDELVWFAIAELNKSGVLQYEMPSTMANDNLVSTGTDQEDSHWHRNSDPDCDVDSCANTCGSTVRFGSEKT